jgi:hypothetical protein
MSNSLSLALIILELLQIFLAEPLVTEPQRFADLWCFALRLCFCGVSRVLRFTLARNALGNFA